jgi:hypothetical protein
MREVDLLSVIGMKYVDHLCSVSSGCPFLRSWISNMTSWPVMRAGRHMEIRHRNAKRRLTFIHQQYQPKVAQLYDRLFHVDGQPFCSWSSPCDSNQDLSEQATIQNAIKRGIDKVEQKQKRCVDQDANNVRFMVGQGGCALRRLDSHGLARASHGPRWVRQLETCYCQGTQQRLLERYQMSRLECKLEKEKINSLSREFSCPTKSWS